MKTIILILFSICMFLHSNAQIKSLGTKQELLNLLKSKHDYERLMTTRNKDNALPFKTKYEDSYAEVRGNKRKIIKYIDNSLKVDSQELSKEVVFYNYQSPASSFIDFRNRMSLLTYYKVIKYSLKTSKSTLPQLSEIPFLNHYHAKKNSLNHKKELLNLLKNKYHYERFLTTSNNDSTLFFKTKYEKSYAKIQNNKRKIIEYIDNVLKFETQTLSREVILYGYKNPLTEPTNMMSILNYYKIIKYSIENKRNTLPQLSEIP